MKVSTIKPVLLAVAATLAVSACATATPYQPVGATSTRGGYAEQRISQDRFRVSFSGNSLTSREAVEMGLLLRSAELTAENGFDWFATVNRAVDRDTRYQYTGDPFLRDRYWPYWGPSWRYYRRGYWGPWGPWGPGGDPFWNDGFDVRQIDRYEATTEIVMGRGPKPVSDPNAFDAREVIANVGPRVMRPMPGR